MGAFFLGLFVGAFLGWVGCGLMCVAREEHEYPPPPGLETEHDGD